MRIKNTLINVILVIKLLKYDGYISTNFLQKQHYHNQFQNVKKFDTPIEISNDEFMKWEAEELELLKKRKLDYNIEDKEYIDDDDEYQFPIHNNLNTKKDTSAKALPNYMLKILDTFNEVNETVTSLIASKLPIIAVIGRPNTGKSTLVNKLTNSHKVIFYEIFMP
jgi:adenylate kinase family enzyme